MKPYIVRNLVPEVGVIVTFSLALAACSSAQTPEKVASERAETATRLDSAAALVSDFRQNIPDSIARNTRCVVVVPGLVKGGLFVGGQSGSGFTACQMASGRWSPPAPVSVSGGSLGAQVGVESADVLALVMTEYAKFTLDPGRPGAAAERSGGAALRRGSRAGNPDWERRTAVADSLEVRRLHLRAELAPRCLRAWRIGVRTSCE